MTPPSASCVRPSRTPVRCSWGDKRYVGPQAIVAAHRFIFDSRDRAAAERLSLLNDNSGACRCRTVFNCTGLLPARDRGIKVTQAITDVKRACCSMT